MSWLKNKRHEVYSKVHDDVNKKGWFQKPEDRAMLVKIYERMMSEEPVNLEEIGQGKSTIYEKKADSLFTRIINNIGHKDEQPANGLVQLYAQSPWYMPRIHKMVEIFAQIHMLEKGEEEYALSQEEHLQIDGHAHNPQQNVHNKEPNIRKMEEEKKKAEEYEKIEHPEEWHLMSDF
jgi:hypothetical protein